MSNMTIMVLGFVVFTTFVLFFGTAMAYLAWRVFEKDSDRIIQRSRENKPTVASPAKAQGKARATRQPSQQTAATGRDSSRSYIDKRQPAPASSGEV
jgi:putative copper export protein